MLTNIVELWKIKDSDEYIFYFLRNRGSERDVSEVRKKALGYLLQSIVL